MRIEREIELSCPPEAVYDVVMDPRRLGDWVTVHRGLRDAPAGLLRAGSRLRQSLNLAGLPLEIDWTVVTAERPERVLWEGRGPAFSHASISYELLPTPTGSRFRYANEFELPGGPLGRIAGAALAGSHLAEREMDRSLERLRALLEPASAAGANSLEETH